MDFQTIKVANLALAFYTLSIRAPAPPFPAVQTFVFPISPQRIRKVFAGMGAFYDTPGTPTQSGVNRDIDRYGTSPFIYDIEGTTGWDLHRTDGFSATGKMSIQNLQQMFYTYDQLNSVQRLNNNPNSYTMEWADYFTGEFYQVEPLGPQEIRASDRAPLLQYYRLRLVGVQPVSDPIAEAARDDIALLLAVQAPSAIVTAVALSTTVLSLY